MSSTSNDAKSTIHERDIPSLADQSVSSQTETCRTELSFCLPTSLAFFKRLTWEQTPWIGSTANSVSANPINMLDAQTIAQYLNSHLPQTVTVEAIRNAVLFGSTYPASPTTITASPSPSEDISPICTSPHLFIIFPHAKGHTTSNPSFLRPWHDAIVAPAFNRAWRDSFLTRIHGAEPDGLTRILAPTGTHTSHDALPAAGFLSHLQNGAPTCVRTQWPAWTTDNWGLGVEGRDSGARARVLDEAWDAMCGMLKSYPGMEAYRDPVLLAVSRARIYVAGDEMNMAGKVRCVVQEWDKVVDARFVRSGSFKVVFQSVAGVVEVEEENEEMPRVWIGDATGRNFKRMGEHDDEGVDGRGPDGDRDVDGHRDKRVRKSGDGAHAD
ncbi:hypothetical protein N0V83_010091 [Neocucurbitaria cava]|uniref:Uncharacterized protein n=1 Tax=Neocucurbitaria cava TaxID=798079 RepID=A0A9W8Y0R2_9PLEO|nr:hypothetical protein N0V83_010091 [Neocucurbitaria cava]